MKQKKKNKIRFVEVKRGNTTTGYYEPITTQNDIEKVCEYCGDTGEVTTDVWDEDSHTYHPTGTGKCICRIEE